MKVSIIIPYNIDRGWLSDAVRSCEHQENFNLNQDYEIIVQHGDCTVGKNMNDAIAKAKGKYIKGCAEDDMLAPGCLNALYNFAEAGGFDFVCADAYTFEGDRRVIDRVCSTLPDTVGHLALENTFHGGTVLYRKDKMPPWNEDFWTAEEFKLNVRMALSGAKFGKLDEVVYWYRSHPKQKSNMFRFADDGAYAKERIHFIRDNIMYPYGNSSFQIQK